jgi:hypothetical protein
MKLLRLTVLVLLAGCVSDKAGKQKSKPDPDRKLSVVISPARDEETTDAEAIEFMASLTISKDELEMRRSLAVDLQYGVDSSFYIMKGRDTLWPAYVMPVANGQPLRPQYIVSFQRAELLNSAVEFRSNMKGLEEINHSEQVSFTATELNNPSK